MELHDIEQRLRNTVDKIEEVGKEYAEARALSWLLQEQKKIVLADAMKKSEQKSVAQKEMDALTSEDYKTHVAGTKEAVGEEMRLRAEYERWQAEFEALRSLISLEKQKMHMT